MKRSIFIFFFFIFTLQNALAFTPRSQKSCEDLNHEMTDWFQDALVNKKRHESAPVERTLGAIRDQKVGWCFAYAAADLLSEAAGQQVSAAHLAKVFYKKNVVSIIRNLLTSNKESGDTEDALKYGLETALCDERDFSSIVYDSYEKVKARSCQRPTIQLQNHEVRPYTATGFYDGYTLFSKVDRILRDGRIAGIEYDNVQLTIDKLDESTQTKANHASTIVGRYFDRNDGACRYIIRNSLGKTCKKGSSKRTKCVDGYYAVTEWQLNNMLTKVISLERI